MNYRCRAIDCGKFCKKLDQSSLIGQTVSSVTPDGIAFSEILWCIEKQVFLAYLFEGSLNTGNISFILYGIRASFLSPSF